jgi:hypothetical protein
MHFETEGGVCRTRGSRLFAHPRNADELIDRILNPSMCVIVQPARTARNCAGAMTASAVLVQAPAISSSMSSVTVCRRAARSSSRATVARLDSQHPPRRADDGLGSPLSSTLML